MITIKQATTKDVAAVARLFDSYRVFYKQSSDIKGALKFLTARMQHKESVIFMAYQDHMPVGFTQLYQTFSSVHMQPVLILNDLFVLKEHRQKSIGAQLLDTAKTYCREKGFKGLALETAIDNPAQKLYEKLGWEKDSHCFHYFWNA